MSIKKYTDWRNWLNGIIDSAVPAGATAVITLVTTNGVASMGGIVADLGMTWKQAMFQIGIHMIIAVAKYLQTKPRPVVVEEDIKTEMLKKGENEKTDSI